MIKTRAQEKLRLSFFFIFLIGLVMAMIFLPRISIPLMVSYVVYLIVFPAVPTLKKIGISHNVSVIIVFLSLLFLVIYPVVRIVPVLVNEAENVQYYLPKVENYVSGNYKKIQEFVFEKTKYELPDRYLTNAVTYVKTGTTQIIFGFPTYIASILEWLLLVPLFLFFFLRDGTSFKHIVLNLTPNSIFERTYYLSHQLNKKIGDFIFAKFVEASIVGIIITAGLIIMGIKFSLLLGITAAVTNIIPYVGPLLGVIPALLVVLAEYGTGTTLGAMMLLYIIANAIDIFFVFPILVSKIVDLHPVLVVISVILGSQYFGIVGMIVSIPMAAAIKLIIIEVYEETYQVR